ncbi:class I SAM-dependent methyltransferase [Luteimonas sp. FCS-9]|uniref:class I SAM-dependent methyltransferase n=1 Tax=Luteimonas sp. FCS-9 TaxID=1547516 RepID=UPI0009E32291|nr:class I SAM-dependent methyltransferase [Luteimonas sp. FCS-9]
MTATASDAAPLSTAPFPREDARGIARAFLPRHPLGNRYDYYYTLTKLRTDPLYPGVLQALRPTAAPVLDLGCGLGLLAHALHADGQALTYAGVDIDAAKIRRGREVAARAGLADVRLDVLDLAAGLPAHRGSVAILDVLQYLTHERQRALLDEAIAMLVPGARLVIRSGLADDSTRSRTSRITDRLANLAGWMQERARSYPTADGLRAQLEGAGLQTTLRPLYGDTPFNNWLIVGSRA